MSEKRSKYDTDPLDPEFARRTEELMGGAADASAPTADVSRERPTERVVAPQTAPQQQPAPFNEDPTRRLGDLPPRAAAPPDTLNGSYPSIFVPPTYRPPAAGQVPFDNSAATRHFAGGAQTARTLPPQGKPSARPLPGLGLPENLSMILPYAPFYIGLAAGLVELLLVPRAEYRARFHAAQGLALQLAILAGSVLFWAVETVTGSGAGGWLFSLAANIFLVVSMIRVWRGEPHRVAPLEDFTRQLNQKFEPRK